jgi:hypothetical protein
VDAITLGVVQKWIEEHEATLRDSMRESGLPREWEERLAQYPPNSLIPALQRWALLKHFYLTRTEQAERATRSENAIDVARALLRREPVITTLAGNRVEVTGRSYNALANIAAHHLAITDLQGSVARIEQLHAQLLLRYPSRFRRWRIRRRLQYLRTLYGRVFAELLAHRRALYAHALTPDGAPASDVHDGHPAPWWKATSAEDDVRLLVALYEVGPGRYAQLGDPPENEEEKTGYAENFGFHSLLAFVEGDRKLPPAALYDQDLGQVLTSIRAGNLAEKQEA